MFDRNKKLREEVAKLAGEVGKMKETLGDASPRTTLQWGDYLSLGPLIPWHSMSPSRPTTAIERIERIESQIDRILKYLGVREVQIRAVPAETVIQKIQKPTNKSKSNKREQ